MKKQKRGSLVTDPEQNVLCPDCGNVIGAGLDFGFGKVTNK